MLGLHTAKRRTGALAIATAGALIGLGMGPAFAADPPAEADASALTATGALVGEGGLDLNSDECVAKTPGGDVNGAGLCGEGLDTNANVDAFSQEAKATQALCAAFAAGDPNDMYGTENPMPQYVHPASDDSSCATAGVAPIDLASLADISLNDIISAGLAGIQTGTVLDQIAGPLGEALADLLEVNTGLLTQIDTAIKGITVPLQENIPVSLRIGAVEAACAASPTVARGNSRAASVELVVGVPGAPVVVPFEGPNDLDTTPNTPLLSGSLSQLSASIFDGLAATLEASLDGALAPLILLTDALKEAIVNQVLVTLEDTLLAQLEAGLEPLVKGTVNKQVDGDGSDNEVSYTSTNTREIEVTALEVVLFEGAETVPAIIPGAGGATQTLKLARVHCGPNGPGGPPGGNPGLQFDKDADTDDGDAKFTLTVKNPNANAVDNVFVQDFYGKDIDADDVEDVKATQGSFNKNTGRWDVGTLAGGATAKLTFKVKTDDDDLDDGIKNAACVNQASKPGSIQKNDGVDKDTDGCDEDEAQKDAKDEDDDDGPKSVDSGLNDGGNLGPLAIAGLLAASTLVGSAARQRLLLDR
jgi:hypothetical protein